MTKCSGDRCVYIYIYIYTLETYIHWRDRKSTLSPFFALSSKDTGKKKDDKYIPTLGLDSLVGGKNKISVSYSRMMLRKNVEQVMDKEYQRV